MYTCGIVNSLKSGVDQGFKYRIIDREYTLLRTCGIETQVQVHEAPVHGHLLYAGQVVGWHHFLRQQLHCVPCTGIADHCLAGANDAAISQHHARCAAILEQDPLHKTQLRFEGFLSVAMRKPPLFCSHRMTRCNGGVCCRTSTCAFSRTLPPFFLTPLQE